MLFSNGTVIVFDEAAREDNLQEKAIKLMKEFGPVHVGTSAGDMRIIPLTKTDGWIVSGHGPGMYTYVHPRELKDGNTAHIAVGVYGRSKRDKDSKELKIVHINRKTR